MRPVSRTLAVVVATLALGAACDSSDPSAAPEPAPTVTVTETVTPSPSQPQATDAPVDPCAALVGGEGLAFVFVTSPAPGTMVQSGFTFSGCSNTFEATHQWRLKDRDGAVLANGFGTATCGTGCVGTFQQEVTYQVSQTQVGTLEVFTSSAEDGSDQDMNSIPLVLQP